MSRQEGVTERQLQDLADFEGSDAYDAATKAALRYADAMTATPVEVSDALFAELREHFDDKQLVELTSCIAWENYRARFDHALHIGPAGFSEGAFCPVPQTAAAPGGGGAAP